MDTGDSDDVAGWYGKISSLGDFAQRRMSSDWVRVVDPWLSASMAAGRERYADRWLDVYLTAPVLRFAWAPGIVDSRWWFGVLMPSCDSVGRYFPLLIAQPRARAPEDRIAFDHLELWFEQLSQAALATLRDDGAGSVDGLEAALADAPLWPTPGRSASMTASEQPYGQHLALGVNAHLGQWLRSLATSELAARLAGCSVWWRVSEDRSADEVDIVHGLPEGDTFADMLVASH